MTLSWQPVIWVDILGAFAILVLATLCVFASLNLLRRKDDKHFHHYLFLLSLSFVLFAVSRSFGHIVKQALLYWDLQQTWNLIAPYSGTVNTVCLLMIFSFSLYFDRSRKVYHELVEHKDRLTRMVSERTQQISKSNLRLKQEISERNRTEKELEKTINEFSAVMDSIDYGILFMDDQLQARIINQAFRKIWGVPDDFVDGLPTLRNLVLFNRYNDIYDVADEEFEHYMDERIAKVRKGPIPPTEFRRRDGMVLQYQCVVLPNDWRMLTYFDITELKKTQEKLAQSQKMEALGMMAGGVAHDLNNILTGIVGYPEILLMKVEEDSELRKPLEIIKASGQRAAQVVQDLLTVARGAATKREVHSLNTLITEHIKSPEGLKLLSSHKEIHVRVNLAEDLLNISCSPIHIKKCLMNLLLNGVEAIERYGNIMIKTRNQHMEAVEYVVLSITDSGKGIAEQDINHIFEPFYTKKTMGRSGTGLGLAIVWNTVKEHGGTITVNSDEEGTCFELYFPVTREKSSSNTEGIHIHQLQGRGELILVVDDEKQQRDVAVHLLKPLGYRVETVGSGEEALAFVDRQEVDLLILDMIMDPGMNGRQTYEQVLKKYPQQRALITSGYSENSDVKNTLELGAGGFIQKPYTIKQLGTAVRKVLDSSPDDC